MAPYPDVEEVVSAVRLADQDLGPAGHLDWGFGDLGELELRAHQLPQSMLVEPRRSNHRGAIVILCHLLLVIVG